MAPATDKLILKIKECIDLAAKSSRWRTHHKLDSALKVAGFELADILEGKQKIGKGVLK